jgi:imidazolonepropionase-like amidohydrolase
VLRILLGLFSALIAVLIFLWTVLRVSTRLPTPLAASPPGGTLEIVTLVVPGGERLEAVSVRIEGDRTAEVGPPIPGEGPFRGAYVFPGLFDVHVHFPPIELGDEVALNAFLYLLHGVSTVRSLGVTLGNAGDRAQAGTTAGEFAGPRVLRCALVDGPNGLSDAQQSSASWVM